MDRLILSYQTVRYRHIYTYDGCRLIINMERQVEGGCLIDTFMFWPLFLMSHKSYFSPHFGRFLQLVLLTPLQPPSKTTHTNHLSHIILIIQGLKKKKGVVYVISENAGRRNEMCKQFPQAIIHQNRKADFPESIYKRA